MTPPFLRTPVPRSSSSNAPRKRLRPLTRAGALGLALAWLALSPSTPSHAARIAEPETVLYGRVVQRFGTREFPITRGTLVWTFRTGGPAGRTHRLTTPLQSLADGRFSYALRLPHQALAYDLTVATSTLPLSAAPTPILDLAVTLDGQPLSLLPLATDSLAVSQKSRATSRRIDLEWKSSDTASDSDGDGLPDWWEDQNGLDKWDPADAATAFPVVTPTPAGTAQARTFAEWRAATLPEDNRPLEIVAGDDPDRDGVANLLEYAFDLNPTAIDPDAATALPHLDRGQSPPSLVFRRRSQATDLRYVIEGSSDLAGWSALGSQPAEGTPPDSRFFRVRVIHDTAASATAP